MAVEKRSIVLMVEETQQVVKVVDDFEQLVVFQLSDEYYGLDIGAVNTIIRMQAVTEIPGTPDFVEGVINLRGKIIPVIDIRKRFDVKIAELKKTSRIVVIETNEHLIGMIVDAVAQTMRVSKSSIEQPSSLIDSVDSDCIRGIAKVDDRLVILLNLDKLLNNKEITTVQQIDEAA